MTVNWFILWVPPDKAYIFLEHVIRLFLISYLIVDAHGIWEVLISIVIEYLIIVRLLLRVYILHLHVAILILVNLVSIVYCGIFGLLIVLEMIIDEITSRCGAKGGTVAAFLLVIKVIIANI